MNIQDELAQRDRKHRDKYTGKNKRHLEEVETITRTGETDQGVTVSPSRDATRSPTWVHTWLTGVSVIRAESRMSLAGTQHLSSGP